MVWDLNIRSSYIQHGGYQVLIVLISNFMFQQTEDEVKDGPRTEYQVYVRTGDTIGAATKADVRITLYGEKGRSKEITLGKSERNKVKFQRGKVGIF